ncbi:hypothetical protein BC828DRAFT_413669 [Blastocladiella britannica]|nr:hypothetical protein BC828DRAFT_413669 [Blastocladiella britannica]
MAANKYRARPLRGAATHSTARALMEPLVGDRSPALYIPAHPTAPPSLRGRWHVPEWPSAQSLTSTAFVDRPPLVIARPADVIPMHDVRVLLADDSTPASATAARSLAPVDRGTLLSKVRQMYAHLPDLASIPPELLVDLAQAESLLDNSPEHALRGSGNHLAAKCSLHDLNVHYLFTIVGQTLSVHILHLTSSVQECAIAQSLTLATVPGPPLCQVTVSSLGRALSDSPARDLHTACPEHCLVAIRTEHRVTVLRVVLALQHHRRSSKRSTNPLTATAAILAQVDADDKIVNIEASPFGASELLIATTHAAHLWRVGLGWTEERQFDAHLFSLGSKPTSPPDANELPPNSTAAEIDESFLASSAEDSDDHDDDDSDHDTPDPTAADMQLISATWSPSPRFIYVASAAAVHRVDMRADPRTAEPALVLATSPLSPIRAIQCSGGPLLAVLKDALLELLDAIDPLSRPHVATIPWHIRVDPLIHIHAAQVDSLEPRTTVIATVGALFGDAHLVTVGSLGDGSGPHFVSNPAHSAETHDTAATLRIGNEWQDGRSFLELAHELVQPTGASPTVGSALLAAPRGHDAAGSVVLRLSLTSLGKLCVSSIRLKERPSSGAVQPQQRYDISAQLSVLAITDPEDIPAPRIRVHPRARALSSPSSSSATPTRYPHARSIPLTALDTAVARLASDAADALPHDATYSTILTDEMLGCPGRVGALVCPIAAHSGKWDMTSTLSVAETLDDPEHLQFAFEQVMNAARLSLEDVPPAEGDPPIPSNTDPSSRGLESKAMLRAAAASLRPVSLDGSAVQGLAAKWNSARLGLPSNPLTSAVPALAPPRPSQFRLARARRSGIVDAPPLIMSSRASGSMADTLPAIATARPTPSATGSEAVSSQPIYGSRPFLGSQAPAFGATPTSQVLPRSRRAPGFASQQQQQQPSPAASVGASQYAGVGEPVATQHMSLGLGGLDFGFGPSASASLPITTAPTATTTTGRMSLGLSLDFGLGPTPNTQPSSQIPSTRLTSSSMVYQAAAAVPERGLAAAMPQPEMQPQQSLHNSQRSGFGMGGGMMWGAASQPPTLPPPRKKKRMGGF